MTTPLYLQRDRVFSNATYTRGTRVYPYSGPNYGLVADDAAASGVPHMAVTAAPDALNFFTVPTADVGAIIPNFPTARKATMSTKTAAMEAAIAADLAKARQEGFSNLLNDPLVKHIMAALPPGAAGIMPLMRKAFEHGFTYGEGAALGNVMKTILGDLTSDMASDMARDLAGASRGH